MSLFDVIKYPITAEFNKEDLEQIPADMLIDWWENAPELYSQRICYSYISDLITDPDTAITRRVHYIRYVLNCYDSRIRLTVLKSLKKYIEEYELA